MDDLTSAIGRGFHPGYVTSSALVRVGLAVFAPLCALAQQLAPADDATPHALDRTRAIDWAYC